MVSITLRDQIQVPAEEYISRYDSESANSETGQIVSRVAHLALAVSGVTIAVADTMVGLATAVASIATLGLIEPVNIVAKNFSNSGSFLVIEPYMHLLQVINPQAGDGDEEQYMLTNLVVDTLNRITRDCKASDNLFKKHICLRFCTALAIVVSVISRVIDGMFGVGAVALSFLTLGKIDLINSVAISGLLALTQILFHPLLSIVNTINPWAFDVRC